MTKPKRPTAADMERRQTADAERARLEREAREHAAIVAAVDKAVAEYMTATEKETTKVGPFRIVKKIVPGRASWKEAAMKWLPKGEAVPKGPDKVKFEIQSA